jgi:glycosyltransferase involved in cell wall biosynthesis
MGNVNFKIVVAGPTDPVGEETYQRKILTLVKKYTKHIVFLGTIQPEHMGAFYSFLDVLILPSVNSTEAFGMVQVEAMMMGIPVVASNLPGVRVPIQKTGIGVLVLPRNTQALADAIVRIILNPHDFQTHPSVITRIFSMEKTIRAYEKLLFR